MDTRDIIEGPKDREVQSRSVNNEPGEAEIQKQAEKPFTFLKLPGEIRNMIYGHLLDFHRDVVTGASERRLLHQPPITRVSRQTRAETLPRYYRTVSVFLIETDSCTEWVGYVKKALDAFTGGPLGLSSAQSSLRHLDFMMLDFLAKDATLDSDVHVELEAHVEVDLGTTLEPLQHHGGDNPSEIVAVGTPIMDWTDETVVRTACDQAATRLEEILAKRLAQAQEHWENEDDEEDEAVRIPTSTPEVLRAAVDAMCLFISACPHLKNVSIYDSSHSLYWRPGPQEGMMEEQTLAVSPANEVQSTD